MKYILALILCTILLPGVVFADTITTGNASVNTSVSTNANDGNVQSSVNTSIESTGNSSVHIENNVESHSTNGSTTTNNTYKKIEVNIDGDKQVVESHDPGEIKIQITKRPVTQIPSPTFSPTPKPTHIIPTIIDTQNNKNESISSWVDNFLHDLFSKLFKK